MDSILESIKQYIGPDIEETAFDPDILMHINSALAVLEQLGIETTEPFIVTDYSQTWDDYFGSIKVAGDDYMTMIGPLGLQMLKDFIFASVKISFDPPSSSFVLESLRKIREELTFRILVIAEKIAV